MTVTSPYITYSWRNWWRRHWQRVWPYSLRHQTGSGHWRNARRTHSRTAVESRLGSSGSRSCSKSRSRSVLSSRSMFSSSSCPCQVLYRTYAGYLVSKSVNQMMLRYLDSPNPSSIWLTAVDWYCHVELTVFHLFYLSACWVVHSVRTVRTTLFQTQMSTPFNS